MQRLYLEESLLHLYLRVDSIMCCMLLGYEWWLTHAALAVSDHVPWRLIQGVKGGIKLNNRFSSFSSNISIKSEGNLMSAGLVQLPCWPLSWFQAVRPIYVGCDENTQKIVNYKCRCQSTQITHAIRGAITYLVQFTILPMVWDIGTVFLGCRLLADQFYCTRELVKTGYWQSASKYYRLLTREARTTTTAVS
jgi:hypothetical protein